MSDNTSVDPGIFPLLLFGFALVVLAVELLLTSAAAGALVFAIFIAAFAQTFGGLWEISRGKTYIGSILATFGIWLIGLFLLETLGKVLGLVSPPTLATYFLVLLIPIAMLAVPAFKGPMPLPIRGAFVGLFLTVLCAGVNFLVASTALGLAAGVFALLSALCIFTIAVEHISAILPPVEAQERASPSGSVGGVRRSTS